MSNTCFTQIEIHSTNRYLLYSFYLNLVRWSESEITIGKTTYCNHLCNIAVNSLLTTVEEINNDTCQYDLRGEVNDIEFKDDYILIDTETAWDSKIEMLFDLMLRELDESAHLMYRGVEEGNCYFVTNDPKFENMFHLEISKYDDQSHEVYQFYNNCISDDDVIKKLQEIANSDSDDEWELTEIAEAMGYYISNNSWDYFPNYQKEEA